MHPDIASVRDTGYHAALLHNARNVALGNSTEPMRSWRDQERRICFGYWIEVDPQSDHFRQKFKRRRYV